MARTSSSPIFGPFQVCCPLQAFRCLPFVVVLLYGSRGCRTGASTGSSVVLSLIRRESANLRVLSSFRSDDTFSPFTALRCNNRFSSSTQGRRTAFPRLPCPSSCRPCASDTSAPKLSTAPPLPFARVLLLQRRRTRVSQTPASSSSSLRGRPARVLLLHPRQAHRHDVFLQRHLGRFWHHEPGDQRGGLGRPGPGGDGEVLEEGVARDAQVGRFSF